MKRRLIPVFKVKDKSFRIYGEMLQYLIDFDLRVENTTTKFVETIEGKRYIIHTLDVVQND